MKKRILASLLVFGMLASMLTGCADRNGRQNQSESKVQTESKGGNTAGSEVKLSFYSAPAQADGSNSQWYWDIVKEKFGITFDIKVNSGDGDIMSALLGSGELPDIVIFGNPEDMMTAAQGGMLVNLDDYQEKLNEVYENSNFDIAMDYAKSLTNGRHFALPTQVGDNNGVEYNLQVRWDIYSKIGCPEAAGWEEYLNVIKQMVEKEPETAEGLKMYGLGLFNDWDGNYMRNMTFYYEGPMGYTMDYHGGLVEVKADLSEEPRSILDDNSTYKAGLEYLYKANQMGLIDPDSTAQNYDGFNTKVAAGQYAMVPFNWSGYGKTNVEDFKGYASAWPKSVEVVTYGPYITGCEWYIGIGSKCKNIDKALELLNWYYSREGILTYQRGPEGDLWKMENGKAVYTDKFIALNSQGGKLEIEGGGDLTDLKNTFNSCAVSGWTLDPETNQPYDIYNMDVKFLNELTTDYMRDSWQGHFGKYVDMYSYCLDKAPEMLTVKSNKLSFIPPASDEMVTLTNQIGNLVREASWKMVFAKDKEEFDALWEQVKTDAEQLGMDKVLEDALARHDEGMKQAEVFHIE